MINPFGPYSTGKIDLFTRATIHISRTGWIDFIAPEPGVPAQNPREVAIPREVLQKLLFEDWDRVRLLKDQDEVCPGIQVTRVGAHHRGSYAISIETPQGKVICTDAVATYENMEKNTPMGFCVNPEEFYSAVEFVKQNADVFVPGYDPGVFERYPDGVIVSEN